MNIILIEDIRNLGKLGDSISVKAGYARNYLLPKKKAVIASTENINFFKNKKLDFEKKISEKIEKMKEISESMSKLKIIIEANSKDGYELYGSIGKIEIIKSVSKAGFFVEKDKIQLLSPLRFAGEHKVKIFLYRNIFTIINILIISKNKNKF